ncbi:DUF4419 domain-containing protein [Dactylosporangium sp. NPDC051485]|uniref:DUF4419 domain-containing protein n=1 Tax=Dactylosporangium sp. NPDC051485 TaxID=3154846 RepID=UPI00342078C1
MVTFPVDDVTPAVTPLPTRPLGGLFPDALAFGGDPALPALDPDGVHPLLSAVARAFAEHRPLVLSPDAVWLTIAHGVAQHVRLHAEHLRPRLVRHTGKKRLTVTIDGAMPHDAASWAHLTGSFAKLLTAEIDDANLFECDFSTSTDVERTAGRVVLLDVYSPYFSLWLKCLCGIPSVTLTGTVEDWRRIRARVDAIAGFGLETWCRSLAPIADEFVRAAAGDPDPKFWRRIYNPIDAYGGDVITGWVVRFYPYLKGTTVDVPNTLLELPIGEPRDVTVDPGGFYAGPGVQSSSVPATLSRVVVNVNDRVAGDNRVVALCGGLVGVAQDPDGALWPVAGWYLAPAVIEIDDVIDRIVREHDTTPAQDIPGEAPVEVIALYHRVGSATLFGGRWRLVPASERRYVDSDLPDLWIETLVDLADGRTIASTTDVSTMTTYWVLCRVAEVDEPGRSAPRFRLTDGPADVPVLGTSLAMLLDAALDSGGNVALLETGRLDQLDAVTS